MTVSELLNRVDSHELSEWMCFFKIEKDMIDEHRNDSKKKKHNPDEVAKQVKSAFEIMGAR